MKDATIEELESLLEWIRRSPSHHGVLEMIVCRPQVGARMVLPEGELTTEGGLVGDTWVVRNSSHTNDGSPDPERQLTIMNSRVAALVADGKDRWPLAGDQLYVDLCLSQHNLPTGTRLAIGDAVVVVTAPPHTGCKKFAERFGVDATRLVNSPKGRKLNLRGINARVERSGAIRVGEAVRKLGPSPNISVAPNVK